MRTLETDNKHLYTELENLKAVCSKPTKISVFTESTETNAQTVCHAEACHKASLMPIQIKKVKKIVFLTDQYGKYLQPYLSELFCNVYEVQVISKPNALFREVVSDLSSTLSNLTNEDFVIVLAGTNNLNVKLNDTSALANDCFYTNLLLCSVPAKYEGSVPLNNIDLVNKKIISSVVNFRRFVSNINFLDLFNKFRYADYVQNSIFLNRRGLFKMASLIHNMILNFSSTPLSSCLRPIDLREPSLINSIVNSSSTDYLDNLTSIPVDLSNNDIDKLFLDAPQSILLGI